MTFGELEARANRLAHLFRAAGLVEGDAVAILMENNEHIHAVMWAARRAGLYYVPINTHLTSAEAAYIIDNSAAKAIVARAGSRTRWPASVPSSPPTACPPGPDHRRRAARRLAELPPPNALPASPTRRSTTRSKAICCSTPRAPPDGRRASNAHCPHVPPSEAPGMMAALVSFWMRPDAVYLSPRAAVPHGAVGVVHADAGRRHHDRGDGEVRRRGSAGRHRQTPCHAWPVRSGDVHPDAETARGQPHVVRRVEPRAGDARRRAVPGGHQETDDRLVGARSSTSTTHPPKPTAPR